MKEHLACNIKPAAAAALAPPHSAVCNKSKKNHQLRNETFTNATLRLSVLPSAIKSRLIFIIRAPAKSFAAWPSADKKQPR
jgi:hypothetical protein